ncbi:MAG: SUMF1/EgtB/PvdO family nonheme iron enzyme [Alphaproteobacteria bacterium]|nr:SUMF1/EgtB/PvdO family nonheme iron enzyme [Alphaproteobacteria bacterium]
MAKLQLEYAPGEVLAEKYEIIELLDEGPLGVTYRCRHLRHDNRVRLIMLDPRIAGREHKDAIIAAFKLARSVEHKNLLRLGELGQHAGVAFVTMEDFEGQTLRELMDEVKSQNGEFTLREAAQIAMGVCEAASASNSAGSVVRAIRPEHVLVAMRRTGPGGKNVVIEVKLIGVGLWDLVPDDAMGEDEFARAEGHYLAPELKGVEPAITPAADVYSIGMLFYELLTGAPPLGTYLPPRQKREGLPKHVDDVVEVALSPAASDRHPTPADLAADIQRCFEGYHDDSDADTSMFIKIVVGLGTVVVAAVAAVVYQQSAIDPYQEAIKADIAMRNQILESHARVSPEEARELLKDHPPNMRYVPAGQYLTGRLTQELQEVGGPPAAAAELPAFLIDMFEYPNLAGAPPEYAITWRKANELCTDQGKRLCTAEELEKACRGPENFVYSYGDTFDPEFCGNGVDDVHPSGHFPQCKSNWGVYDVSGNFREWTSSQRNEGRYVVKGGLPQSAERGTRCAYTTDLLATYADDTISFRCCRDLDAGAWSEPKPRDPNEKKNDAQRTIEEKKAAGTEGEAPAETPPAE